MQLLNINFGQSIFDYVQGEAKWLVLAVFVVLGLIFAVKKEFSKLIGTLVIGVIACLLVFNPEAVKDFMIGIGNLFVSN